MHVIELGCAKVVEMREVLFVVMTLLILGGLDYLRFIEVVLELWVLGIGFL